YSVIPAHAEIQVKLSPGAHSFGSDETTETAMKNRAKARQSILIAMMLASEFLFCAPAYSQSLKKIRMVSSSTNVSFLALYTAVHRGFFKDEGIDLEIIYMPANLASTAVQNGDVDYNGAVTGTIGAAVRGQPMKVLLFTVAKPFLFLISKKEIKDM